MSLRRVVELECVAQQYDWGKVGDSSLVYQLQRQAHANRGDSTTTDASHASDTPYSELWMGTHPSGPSRALLPDDGDEVQPTLRHRYRKVLLSQYLRDTGATEHDDQLPFLFKVLSIAKPLSIQAHPDKKLAEELHATQPTIYRDPNHKPELACALTPFEALCGFRPMREIQLHLREVPELVALLPSDLVREIEGLPDDGDDDNRRSQQLVLSRLLHTILSIDSDRLRSSIATFVARVEGLNDGNDDRVFSIEAQRLSVRLNQFFEGDVGVLVALLLNYVRLEPGEAIFLGPNEPHAYISGDCIEAMACSDNVVRAGLTPKLKDASTLCRMLTFTTNVPRILTGERLPSTSTSSDAGQALLYAPGFDEFSVLRVTVPASCSSYSLPCSSAPSIVLVVACGSDRPNSITASAVSSCDTREQTLEVFAGQTWFVPAGSRIHISNHHETQAVELYACSTGDGYT